MILTKYSDAIDKLCQAHHVRQLYAFGSVLTDRFRTDSDIDLMVSFEPMDVLSYADNYYNLKFALEDIFQKPVDLLEEKAIRNPYFCVAVNNQRMLVYEY